MYQNRPKMRNAQALHCSLSSFTTVVIIPLDPIHPVAVCSCQEHVSYTNHYFSGISTPVLHTEIQ